MFCEQQTTPKLISQNSKHFLFLLILRVGWVVYLVWVGSADFCSILAVWLGGGSRMAMLNIKMSSGWQTSHFGPRQNSSLKDQEVIFQALQAKRQN